MTTELAFILVAGGVAAIVAVGALVAVIRERRPLDLIAAPASINEDLGSEWASPSAAPSHEGVVRVVWWVAIAGVLVGIGLTDAFPSNRAAIYALGGVAAGLVVLRYELLPRGWRGRYAVGFEVLAALALASGLVWLTGGAASPFAFTYHLVAVAAALTLGSRLAVVVAAAASLAYLGQLALASVNTSNAELLRVGINLGSLWLLAYLAGVYASSERRVRAQVLELSQSDALTGLYNRGQLFPRLEQEVQRTRRSGRGFCVLMIDLDGLKAINDSMGHLRGDEVLRSVGRVITGSIRGVDAAYRYGGDEFLILLPETEFIGAYVVAEKIREGVEGIGTSLATEEATTSVSIGLVSHPEDGWSAEELMIAADRAMYQAKSLGKNQISGNPRPRRTGPRRLLPSPEEVSQPTPSVGAPFTVAAPMPEPSPASAPAIEAGSTNGVARESHGEDEPDPADVRRHIAAARRNMDPDHQIRRAMDAFLSSPSARPGEIE
ncbi:MAG: GGDEF domain-containing protein [Chloroflexota bacterium]|nr:GGDEF domain-containing protein [Chloroflexota bacterium]